MEQGRERVSVVGVAGSSCNCIKIKERKWSCLGVAAGVVAGAAAAAVWEFLYAP